VHVRQAVSADARAIETIRVKGWRTAYRGVFPAVELDAMPIDETRWLHRLNEPPPGWSIVVAEHEGKLVGFAATGPSRDEQGIGELYAIYVAPDEWSRGAGRALIAEAEDALRVKYDEATLWVLEQNPRARRFYELGGWSLDGARKAEERWGVRAPEVRYRKRLR
jgi:GNAT superfamily N-acetyltransferase